MSTESSVREQVPGPLVLLHDYMPMAAGPLSLYVHIPFCESRCRYCNFYFETGWSSRVLQRTLDGILEESRMFRQILFGRSNYSPIRTIYLGGGTPSIIPPRVMDEFLEAFRGIWNPDPAILEEFALEANPESLVQGHLDVFCRHGINRLSLGVQTFDDELLYLLGRKARAADIERCLEMLDPRRPGTTWTGRVNLDLMVGLPGQTIQALDVDLDRLLDFGPHHVSVYTLTVEERTPLHRLLANPAVPETDDEAAEALWIHGANRLAREGFENYEVSNFALPGCESRHNMAYWRLDPYLGLGPGAVSTLPCRFGSPVAQAGQTGWIRLTNPHAFAYSRPGRPGWQHSTEVLGPRDLLLEHFITGLRTREGLDLGRAEERTGLDAGTLEQTLAPLVSRWIQQGLALPVSGKVLRLSIDGRMILNHLLEALVDVVDGLMGHSGIDQ